VSRDPRDADERAVAEMHRTLSNWGRWGEGDRIGTLHHLTPERVARAAGLVRRGRTVSCSRPLPTDPAVDNPRPVLHHMIGTASEGYGADFFAVASHGYAVSHIDALCHIFHEGRLYGGEPAARVTAHGAEVLSIDALRDGVVGRGVLLDIPTCRGLPWLEPGEPIYPDDLEAAERDLGASVEPGDLLLVRTGRFARREARGPWDPHEALAGLQAACLPWLQERAVAVLGSDGVSDVVPSRTGAFRLPIHSVAITAMGLHLLDNLDLERLAVACREEARYQFLLLVAPLVLVGGTASPVNPIAVF